MLAQLTGKRCGPHPEVELTVADTGPGIIPEDQAHLFEKYQRHRKKSSSSGLGLYICKTLVEANQGRIWVESEPGRGAAFHVALPGGPDGEAPRGLIIACMATHPYFAELMGMKTHHILVIDDDLATRDALADMA